MKPLINNPQIDEQLLLGNFEEALSQPIEKPTGNRLADFFTDSTKGEIRQETSLYAGLTLGDFLYDYIRIDPTVIAGVDFARAEDLKSVFAFSSFAEQHAELAGAQLDGSISQLQGYVAEQLVAHHMEALGHDVTFPATSNQEGWDLLIDGEKFQVKCLSTAAGVHEHLQRFPDIPVIVNIDLADSVGNLHNVYVDHQLVHDQVVQATENSLHYGSELGDFEIPWISLAVSSAFALRDLANKTTNLQGAVVNVLSNTTGRIALGKLGSITAGAAGLMLFGPAGKLIFTGTGAVIGAYFGRRAAGSLRGLLLKEEDRIANDAARDCAREAEQALRRKLLAWNDKRAVLQQAFDSSSTNSRKLGSWMDSRISDDIRYYENKATELSGIAGQSHSSDPRELWERLLLLIKRAGIHPHGIQQSLLQFEEALKNYQTSRRKYSL